MKEIEAALEQGVWAIACTPSGKYIGQLWGLEHENAVASKSYFIDHLSNPVQMRWPQEYLSNLIPKQMRAPDGSILTAFERMIETVVISRCLDVEHLRITLTPTDYMFFTDMGPKDREWHKNLVRRGIRQAWELYLKEAGILPPPGGFHEGHA